MQPTKYRQFKTANSGRRDNNEDAAMARLSTELKAAEHSSNEVVRIFEANLRACEKSGFSIKNVVKLALSGRYCAAFGDSTHEHSTTGIVRLIHADITKPRNNKSNPSIFFKFLGVNNLALLGADDVQKLVDVALDKLNVYISCDKNVLFLVLKLLKCRLGTLSLTTKRAIFDKLLNSYFLYFTELQKEKLRRDTEIVKNYISHFKILSLLLSFRFFESLEAKRQELVVHITLYSFFIGSSFEERIFELGRDAIAFCRSIVVPVHNDFYFSQKSSSNTRSNFDDEISSFSDYNNCVPQARLSDDILKNLYYFVCKLFNGLIDKLPQFFHSPAVWKTVIGENYYITSVQGFFKDSGFANSRLPDMRLRSDVEKQFFAQNVVDDMAKRLSGEVNRPNGIPR